MSKEITKQSLSVKLFAALRQTMNSDHIIVEIDESLTASELKKTVLENYPNLKEINLPILVTVNCELAKESTWIKPTDEVALIPPVSGG